MLVTCQLEREPSSVTNMPPSLGSRRLRAAPDLAVFGDEAGEEVFVAAAGVAVVPGDANDFVAGAGDTVRGATFGGKDVVIILLGGLASRGVEGHVVRGHMGLDEDTGSDPLTSR
jgi:hypothetical protein